MVRLLIPDKQLPGLIRAENRKWKKMATVQTGNISSVPPVILKKHRSETLKVLKNPSISH